MQIPPIQKPSFPGKPMGMDKATHPSASWATLYRLVPALDSLRTYTLRSFQLDLMAGLTVATVAVPQAMAYALIAGIPPVYGLYTAIVMTAVGALLDSSRQLINGPTNAISIALLSALVAIPLENRLQAAVLMALMVGLIQTGITLFRMGDLSRYISHAVIVGFTLGAGCLLVLDQLKNLLGIPGASGEHFMERFFHTMAGIGQFNPWTVGVGLGTIGLVVLLRKLKIHFLKPAHRLLVPEFLLVTIGMAALVPLTGLDRPGVGVAVIGEIPAQLPSFTLPEVRWLQVQELAGSALAIALLGLLEAIAMAKAIAAQTGQKLDINQQCLSEGMANLTGSFFQCFPGSGSLTRSMINQQAGAVSQWSGVISAAAVAATMLVFAPFASYIPKAALAGILVVSAWRMVDRKQLWVNLRATRSDAGVVIVTALSAVLISVEFCILIGVFLSFVLYVPRASRLHRTELILTPERVIRERVPADPVCDRLLIYNLEGELFFGSAPDLERHLGVIEHRCRPTTRVVVLRLKRARNPDAVCLGLLEDFFIRMDQRKIVVLLCGVRRDLYKVLRNTGLNTKIGAERIFRERVEVGSSTLDAVRFAYELLQGDYCSTCPRRGEIPTGKESWYYMI
jgi:SulP family sulfate permease